MAYAQLRRYSSSLIVVVVIALAGWNYRNFSIDEPAIVATASHVLLLEAEEHTAAIGALGVALVGALLLFSARMRQQHGAAQDSVRARLGDIASFDPHTGLGNHHAFSEGLQREVARSLRHDRPLTLAFLDIDSFKTLNATHGRAYGDEVLSQIAQVLTSLRPGDVAYRTGADEFALLLVETNSDAATRMLAQMREALQRACATVTVSVGLAEFERGDGFELRERAGEALREAQRLGPGATIDFDRIRATATIVSPTTSAALRRLLDVSEQTLEIAFQPIWDRSISKIIGFEALARPLRSLGFASPSQAFDIAERLNLTAELDGRCHAETLRSAAGLARDLYLFMNIVPETIVHPSFDVAKWVNDVRRAGIDPKQIVLEITERRISDPENIAERIKEFQSHGVRVALDDTGTGHAGFEILSLVAFDFVKIDRGVVVNAQHSVRARAVLSGIIAIAQASGSMLIAEGIERAEQLAFVRHAHEREESRTDMTMIHAVQGYLLGTPRIGPIMNNLHEHTRRMFVEPMRQAV